MGTIVVIENINRLDNMIENYDEIKKENKNIGNNDKFCKELEDIVDKMFAERK